MTSSEQTRKEQRLTLLPIEFCAPGYREDAERAARWLRDRSRVTARNVRRAEA